jgi:hypothetical protein
MQPSMHGSLGIENARSTFELRALPFPVGQMTAD